MGVIWGIVAASLIGCSDSAARVTARRCSISVLVLVVVWLSLAALLAIFGVPEGGADRIGLLALSAVAGCLHIMVLFLLYPALARGPVSIAVAAASVSVLILVGLNIAAGSSWNWMQIACAFAVLLGIVMTTRREGVDGVAYSPRHLRITALLGLGAGTVSAIRIFFVQEGADQLGAVDSLIAMRAGAAVAIIPAVAIARMQFGPLQWPRGPLLAVVLMQVLSETLAFLAFLHGSAVTSRVGVAVGFGSTPLMSTLAARVFLGDPIGKWRGIWIAFVAAAVMLAVVTAPEQP